MDRSHPRRWGSRPTPPSLPTQGEGGQKAPPNASLFSLPNSCQDRAQPLQRALLCSSGPWAAGALAPGCNRLSEVTFQPQLILRGPNHGGPLFQEARGAAPFLWTPIGLLVHSSNIRGEGKGTHADCLPLVCLAHFNFHNSSGVGLDFPFFQMRKPGLR